MTPRKTSSSTPDALVAAGGVALLASILGNLKQHGDNEHLQRSVEAMQRLVKDWQASYHNLDAQLALALRSNEEQNRLIASIREELRQVQARTYEAEQRALEAEAALEALKKRSDKGGAGDVGEGDE